MSPRAFLRQIGCGCLMLAGPVLALQDDAVEVQPLARSVRSWDGTLLPSYLPGQPEVTILRIRIAPGARLPVHRHPTINAGFVLAGTLTVVTEQGQTLRLKAGDPIVEVVGQWHYGHNDGSEPVELIVFTAGIEDLPITVKE